MDKKVIGPQPDKISTRDYQAKSQTVELIMGLNFYDINFTIIKKAQLG